MIRPALTAIVILIVVLMKSGRPMTATDPHSYLADRWTASATQEAGYFDVVDYLMPVPTKASIPDSVEWRATVRTLFLEAEHYIVLTKNFGDRTENISVAVVRPEGRTVLDQLALILIHHPHATVKDAAALVNVRRWTVTGAQCRAIKDLAVRFATIRAPVVPSSGLVMDPPHYDVAVETRSESTRFSLNGTGAAPLVAWINETNRRIATECIRER